MEAAQDAMMYGRLAIAAASVGGMKRCAQLMLGYAQRRSISTGRLLDNPVTLTRLSDLTAAITAVESLVAGIAELLDQGRYVPVEAYTVCKIAGPEFFWKAADTLVQMLGGRGYIETNIAPQILRDARILRIFEGPTETLTMFLGSRVINNDEELHQFLCHTLGAPTISERLREAAKQINKRCAGPGTPFSDQTTTTQWAYMLIGEVATFAVLLAAVQRASERSESEPLRRAIEWTQLHFEQKVESALSGPLVESVVSGADAVSKLISNYAEAIGVLEQTLAGADHELDALLRQERSEIAPGLKSHTALEIPEKSGDRPLRAVGHTKSPPTVFTHTLESIQDWVIHWMVRELRLEDTFVDASKPFAHYGMDSVKAVELAQALEDWLGSTLKFEATMAWNFPTIESLARHLASELDISASAGLSLSKSTSQAHSKGHFQSQKVERAAGSLLNEPVRSNRTSTARSYSAPFNRDGPPESESLDTLSESEMAQLLAEEIATIKKRK